MIKSGAPLFPQIYNTEQSVRDLATAFIRIMAVYMPFGAFLHASYFTLRSGGKTWVTFLFDSVYLWIISIPVARMLSTGTDWHIILVYGICQR